MKKTALLISGASGFIGKSFIKKFLNQFDIYTISKTTPLNISGVKKEFIFDLSNHDNLKALNDLNIDVVMHLGGQSSEVKSFNDPLNDFQANTQSTINLLEFSREKEIKQFIYASSQALYKIEEFKEVYSETDKLAGNSIYSNSKIASENFIKCYSKHYNIPYTILRYFSIYGPGQNLNIGIMNAFIKQFQDQSIKSIEVKGSLERFRDFIYIDDVVSINNKCILNKYAMNKTINVGSGTKTTMHELLSILKDVFNSEKTFFESKGTKENQFGLYANIHSLRSIYKTKLTVLKKGINNYLKFLTEKET